MTATVECWILHGHVRTPKMFLKCCFSENMVDLAYEHPVKIAIFIEVLYIFILKYNGIQSGCQSFGCDHRRTTGITGNLVRKLPSYGLSHPHVNHIMWSTASGNSNWITVQERVHLRVKQSKCNESWIVFQTVLFTSQSDCLGTIGDLVSIRCHTGLPPGVSKRIGTAARTKALVILRCSWYSGLQLEVRKRHIESHKHILAVRSEELSCRWASSEKKYLREGDSQSRRFAAAERRGTS